MLYIIIAIISIISIITIYITTKLTNNKIRYNSLNQAFIELKERNKLLEDENKDNIKQAEHYKTKSSSLEEKINDLSIINNKSMDNAKDSLINLGNKLSQQLIDLHKKENHDSRIASEERINKTTEKFYQQTEKIMSLVNHISKDVDSSKSSVEMIKKSLLTPLEVGAFAEMTLENILKNSGLIEDTDYIIQKTIYNNDNISRPDSIIFLPGDNVMVIDAKSSKFIANESPNIDQDNKLSDSINKHMEILTSKDYSYNINNHFKNKKKNIMTFMFLPTEHVLERVYKADRQFLSKAQKKQIFPIGPAGLINIISIANVQINDAKRINNYNLILDEVIKLTKAVSTLGEHSNNIGNSLKSLISNYDKFARSFNRNLLPKINNLDKMGLENKKNACIPIKRYNIINEDFENTRKEPVEA